MLAFDARVNSYLLLLRLIGLVQKSVLDVSCGIGTQAIALALNGYAVTGSDLSKNAIKRAAEEAAKRNVDTEFSVCDMREAHAHHGTGFDVVVSADNSIRICSPMMSYSLHSDNSMGASR